MLILPKTSTVDGLIKRTSSILGEIVSKTMDNGKKVIITEDKKVSKTLNK